MSKQTQYPKIQLCGVDIDGLTIDEAIQYIVSHAAHRQSPSCYVIKPYVEFLDRAAQDPAVRQLLNGAELAIADGVALTWSAHFLYAGPRSFGRFCRSLASIVLSPDSLNQPLPERVAGINLTWPLLQAAQDHQLRVFLIGKATQAEIDHTANIVGNKFPQLKIAGTRSGYDPSRPVGDVGEAWLRQTLDVIKEARPDLILVGMGFPLQEHVMERLSSQLKHGVFIGEGGTFDYEQFGGRRRRAPEFIQHTGLEWLWRLILQPSRLGRQLAIPRYIWYTWRHR